MKNRKTTPPQTMAETVERLTQLRDWFATVPEEKVRMESWGEGFNKRGKNADFSCLTAGCLAGWAGAYKPFNKLGLRNELMYGGAGVIDIVFDAQFGPWTEPVRLTDEGAFQHFFGISDRDAYRLVSPSTYDLDAHGRVSKKAVLKRLDETIRDYKNRQKNGDPALYI